MTFCVWLISLGIMFSKFIGVVACIRTSFLLLVESCSNMCIYHISFIYSAVEGNSLDRFYLLALMMVLQWTLVYKYQFESLFSTLLCTYLGVELLDHMVILFSFLMNCQTMFYRVVVCWVPWLYCNLMEGFPCGRNSMNNWPWNCWMEA